MVRGWLEMGRPRPHEDNGMKGVTRTSGSWV